LSGFRVARRQRKQSLTYDGRKEFRERQPTHLFRLLKIDNFVFAAVIAVGVRHLLDLLGRAVPVSGLGKRVRISRPHRTGCGHRRATSGPLVHRCIS